MPSEMTSGEYIGNDVEGSGKLPTDWKVSSIIALKKFFYIFHFRMSSYFDNVLMRVLKVY